MANPSLTLLASGARTATAASNSVETRGQYRGVHVMITSTAASATPSVVFTIQGYNSVTDAWYDILASAAVTDGSTSRVLRVFPGATAATNLTANDVLPAVWRVNAVHADADSITYSVVANPLP